MRKLFDLLKSLIVGGVVFLLPIGIVLVVFGKLLAVSTQIGDTLQRSVFPGFRSDTLVLVIAILILTLIALVAGIFARTPVGMKSFAWLEEKILARLPIYTVLRQMIADLSGSVETIGEGREVEVVAVRFDDQMQIGFLIDHTPSGLCVVFMPGAPSALSGTVVIVEADRVTPTELSPAQVMNGMRRLGAGLSRVITVAQERN